MAHSPLLYPTRTAGNVSVIRRMSMETYMVRIYTGPLSQEHEFVSVEAEKATPAHEVVRLAINKLKLSDSKSYELAEVFSSSGQLCKERRLEDSENPVRVQLLWPRVVNADYDQGLGLHTGYRFYVRKKNLENSLRTSSWMEYTDPNPVDNFLTSFLKQPTNKEYSDLCNLPDLNERTLLENIKSRFVNSNIYTYVGSILIAVNPFKFFPIYNPKYVKMYQNKRLGDLPPHIFAIADAAFHTMLRTKKNQCIVISGESGSGKTESTNLLLHHLTALSHKGLHGSGVEQTILGAGPVLEAFGNAKTVHNNNSSRFGKFIQVNYKENGMVHGAIVEKYLLEKSRIVSQARNERNYHVFYYLLQGADDLERTKLHLGKPEDYFYLKQSGCIGLEEVDEANEFSRLKQSMEMVGFSQVTQKRIFGVLSAVLHLGNVKFKKKGDQHHDESVTILNPETITVISQVLKVQEKTLIEALTQKKATAGDETVVMTHRMEDAVATRDAMAKCLYGALFDWIVLKVNQALLAKRHNSEHLGNSIGVLDIFGFEDFQRNSFEQFCINYANEHLQYYFNQHIFKFEQEEYKKEGIQWKNIEFIDNTGCLELFSKKNQGLFCLLDEECNFPAATNETLLTKFHHKNKGNIYYEAPQKREMAFTVMHYAGKVKYEIKDFREKNSDQIRTDIVGNLKSSSLSFVRELMGVDPVAVLRWTILKTLFKSVFAFIKAGKTFRERGGPSQSVVYRRKQSQDIIPELGSTNFLRPPPGHHGHLSPNSSSMHVFRYSKHTTDPSSPDTPEGDEVFTRSPSHSPRKPSHSSPRHPGHSPRPSEHIMSPAVDPYLSEDEANLMRQASLVLLKNKSFKPKSRPQTMFSDIKTLKAIASRTMYSGGKVSTKQKPPSVSAQFQWSLMRLMATLNQANPFFIRCIKSNAEKQPCTFNEVLVLRQLRYTGMLATVRIRQSGYNYRLTFEEFTQLYKILLPKGLESEKADVKSFLESMHMDSDNFQIGKTKVFLREGEKLYLDECLHRAIMARVICIQRWVFLREGEKLYLDECLHRAIMARVICIQRWVKTKVERKNFLLMRENAIILQKHIRVFLAQRRVLQMQEAVYLIQRWYRGSRVRLKYNLVRQSAIKIQSHVKGHLSRKRYLQLREEAQAKHLLDQDLLKHSEDMHSSTSDEGVLVKDTSADELDIRYFRRDSEESSGILDDSESDTLSEAKSRGESISTPPPTPTSIGPEIVIEGLPVPRDDYLSQSKHSSRVQNLTRVFQSPDSSHGDDAIDGRGPHHTIFIPRGGPRQRSPMKESTPAPLAKQESFSDLDSPTTDKPSQLSPERMKHIEEALKKPRTPESLPIASADDIHKSPIKNAFKKLVAQESLRETKSFPAAYESDTLRRRLSFSTSSLLRRTKSSIKLLRDMKSTKKKNSYPDDSDNEDETSSTTGRRQPGGVQVLPHQGHPTSPKSPVRDDVHGVFSDVEQPPEDKRAIKKQRRTLKQNKDKDLKDNRAVEQQKGWNVSKTSQWQYPADWVISETYELQLLDDFINLKILGLTRQKGEKAKESQFDMVFEKCLRSFHSELKSTLSVVMQKNNDKCNIKYRDLFAQFEGIMEMTCESEKLDSDFPVTICINAFRGFLDEFRNSVNSVNTKKKENKYKKKMRPKREKLKKDTIDYQGHKFSQVQFGIPTFCELCSNIIWIMEKGYVCQVCKYTCHKKCIYKSSTPCKGAQDSSPQLKSLCARPLRNGIPIGRSVNDAIVQFNLITQVVSRLTLRLKTVLATNRLAGTKVFCVPLPSLVEEGEKIPVFLENLIMLVENHGLFTEGIYRKSGSAPKMKMLKMALDNGTTDVNIDDFSIHVISSTLKSFFRELPEPLLTFELYDEFVQASEIQVEKEAIQVLYSLVERLPKVNHDVFERIIFHLARVANHEKSNKMSVNGLAIIFAPCLLRTNKKLQAQEMLSQVSRQTIVIDMILEEQLRKLQTTLQDIKTLESAENTANERLTVVRASMRNSKSPKSPRRNEAPPSLSEEQENLEEQERVIHSHLKSLRKEKDDLTQTLPTLEYRHSSDDEMLSADDIESTYDTADEETPPTFDIPVEKETELQHLTKYRAPVPRRRPPSNFRQSSSDSADDKMCQSIASDKQCDNVTGPEAVNDDKSESKSGESETVSQADELSVVSSGVSDNHNLVPGNESAHSQETHNLPHQSEGGSKVQRRSIDNSVTALVTQTGNIFHKKPDSSKEVYHTGHKLTKPLSLPYLSGTRSDMLEKNKQDLQNLWSSPKLRTKVSRSHLVDHARPSIHHRAGALRLDNKSKSLDDTRLDPTEDIVDDTLPDFPDTRTPPRFASPPKYKSPPKHASPPYHLSLAVQHSLSKERVSSHDNTNITTFEIDSDTDDEIMV